MAPLLYSKYNVPSALIVTPVMAAGRVAVGGRRALTLKLAASWVV